MIKYDKNRMTLYVDNKRIKFTLMQFKIFNLLIKKHPLYATYEEISKELYDIEDINYTKECIYMHIFRLRKKIKKIFVITNKNGLGVSINFDRAYLKKYD